MRSIRRTFSNRESNNGDADFRGRASDNVEIGGGRLLEFDRGDESENIVLTGWPYHVLAGALSELRIGRARTQPSVRSRGSRRTLSVGLQEAIEGLAFLETATSNQGYL